MTTIDPNDGKPGRKWAFAIAVATMVVTLIPYMVGQSLAGNRQFMWLGYNLDDSCVYLSWMRQAFDGALTALNLFTTEPQHGMAANPLFLVLGWLSRATHLPLLVIYHASRILFGIMLIMVAWEFIRANIPNTRQSRLSLLFICFASGLGWIPALWELRPLNAPVDTWQPEAITFLSLYLSPLFCFSMALQVAILLFLQRGELTGNIRYALLAGASGLLLALVHTYDVITMSAVWLTYLIIRTVTASKSGHHRPLARHVWVHAVAAGALTLPGVMYIAWQLRTEAVFQARADVKTLAAPLIYVLLGYGGLLLLALIGAYFRLRYHGGNVTDEDRALEDARKHAEPDGKREVPLLIIVWSVVNLAVSYLPGIAFQRKLLQGEHIPIAILAGSGMCWLLGRSWFANDKWRKRFVVGITVFLLFLTNLQFMMRDITNFQANRAQTGIHRTYLEPGEIAALNWVASNTSGAVAIQPLPWIVAGGGKIAPDDIALASFTPELIHRSVYCGHWGETPEFGQKLGELIRFMRPNTPDMVRIDLLRKMKVGYLVFSQKGAVNPDTERFLATFKTPGSLPTYLVYEYGNADADVYRVALP